LTDLFTVISALNILNAQRAAEFLISTGNFQCFSSTHSLATHANTAHAALQQKPKNADIYGEITLMLSFISNFSATLLIAFKAWFVATVFILYAALTLFYSGHTDIACGPICSSETAGRLQRSS
jgi:hypothetical protein